MNIKNKKLLYIVISAVLAVALITAGTIYFFNSTDVGNPKLIIEEVDGEAGQTIEVPVLIKNNPGTWGGQIIIDFDSDNLSFISADIGTIYESCSINLSEGDNSSTDSVVIVAEHEKILKNNKAVLVNSYHDGNIVVLKFMIKVGAKKGEHKLTINTDTNFCDRNAQLIENISFENGIINVE